MFCVYNYNGPSRTRNLFDIAPVAVGRLTMPIFYMLSFRRRVLLIFYRSYAYRQIRVCRLREFGAPTIFVYGFMRTRRGEMLFEFDANDRGNSPRKRIFGAIKEIAFNRSFRLKCFFLNEFSKLFFS